MAFPRKLLGPGEEIAAESRPNWSVLVGPALAFLAVLAACIAVFFLWGSAPIVVGYVLAGVAFLGLCWLLGQIASWRSRLLVVTNRRVIYRWGVLRRTGREIPLDRVQDVTYHQSLFERVLGTGSLLIESAGASGQEPFPDIRRPDRMQSLINELVSQAGQPWSRQPPPARPLSRREQRHQQASEPPPPHRAVEPRWVRAERDPTTGQLPVVDPLAPGRQPASGEPTASLPPLSGEKEAGLPADIRQELRDLEELHDAGVLTDAEFDRKRREILGF